MKAIENLKEKILKEYERYGEDDKFSFGCHPGVPCYNNCCADVNIFLTPLDIIRLKNRLKITSEEFLNKYTILPFDVNQSYPVVLLKMSDNEKKSCQFVAEKGCTVYSDRPWACRMYPLGKASTTENTPGTADKFYFILKEDVCKGFGEPKEWTIREWISSQAVEEYDEIGEMFKNITLNKFFREGRQLSPQKMEMFHTVCYNIDKFRDFVFKSSFLQRFDVPPELIEDIERDEIELLKFGFDWLRYSLFEEHVDYIKINKSH